MNFLCVFVFWILPFIEYTEVELLVISIRVDQFWERNVSDKAHKPQLQATNRYWYIVKNDHITKDGVIEGSTVDTMYCSCPTI